MSKSLLKWLPLMFFSLLFFLGGCTEEEEVPLDEIPLDLTVFRSEFEMNSAIQELNSAPITDTIAWMNSHFQESKAFLHDYLYGGDPAIGDTIMAYDLSHFLADSAVQALVDSVIRKYPQDFPFAERLVDPFKRLKWYFPELQTPEIYTFVPGYHVDPMGRIDQTYLNPPFLGIGLHYYMGKEFSFYPPVLPEYIRQRFEPEYLERNIFKDYADQLVPPLHPMRMPTLLDKMIHEGKKYYFLEKILPHIHDTIIFAYTADEMDWALYYEGRVFAEMIDNLYSKDFTIHELYLLDSPYTSGKARESAPRLGEFIGYRIVEAFMDENPEVTLEELIKRQDYEKIFNQSKYKPPAEVEE